MMGPTPLAALLIIGLISSLGGCGQKGPLFLASNPDSRQAQAIFLLKHRAVELKHGAVEERLAEQATQRQPVPPGSAPGKAGSTVSGMTDPGLAGP